MTNKTRTGQIHFMVTPEERAMIEKRMAQAGIKNMRAFLLKMAIDGQVVHVELSSVKEMTRLLSNATNNINQIARRVNQTGSIYADDIRDLQSGYETVCEQTKVILRKIADM
jgi:CRISPR/Cas system-associated endonuclease Cas1